MTLDIGVFYSWDGSGPEQQWPGRPPERYADIRFHFGSRSQLDHVFVLNDVPRTIRVQCDPDRVWGLIQEPPTEFHTQLQAGRPFFARVHTTDETLCAAKYRQFWGALQWAVGMSYDELMAAPYPQKRVGLAWVTSNLTWLPGHQKRMQFLEALRAAIPELSLYGRGIRPIARKWDALSPARYSIAFENFAGGIYWSEKLTDCFLSYSTPFYYGARDIDRYFPKNSYIPLDPEDPLAIDKVREIIASDFHEQHRSELLEARDLCLNKYNTLFFLADLAIDHNARHGAPARRESLRLTPRIPPWKRTLLRLKRSALSPFSPETVTALRRLKRRLFRQA